MKTPIQTDSTPPSPDPNSGKGERNWIVFWLSFFAPATLTVLCVRFVSNEGNIAPNCALVGSAVSAMIGGFILGRWWGRTSTGRIGLTLLFSFLLGIVIFSISCFGCMISGYRLNLR